MQPRATREDYERALAGLPYPVSKAAVVRKAEDHGGIDAEVDAMLMQLPDRSFASFEDLIEAIRATYLTQAGGESSSPV